MNSERAEYFLSIFVLLLSFLIKFSYEFTPVELALVVNVGNTIARAIFYAHGPKSPLW